MQNFNNNADIKLTNIIIKYLNYEYLLHLYINYNYNFIIFILVKNI